MSLGETQFNGIAPLTPIKESKVKAYVPRSQLQTNDTPFGSKKNNILKNGAKVC